MKVVNKNALNALRCLGNNWHALAAPSSSACVFYAQSCKRQYTDVWLKKELHCKKYQSEECIKLLIYPV